MENRFSPFTDAELLELSVYFGVHSPMSEELIAERKRRLKPAPIVIGLQGIEPPDFVATQ